MQPLVKNRNEEYKLAQRSFSLFDRRTLSALMLLGVVHCTSAAEEPLPPDQAFQFEAVSTSQEGAELTWKIADGYYLYHHQLKVSHDQKALKLSLPVPQDKDDPTFGKTEVHYENVTTQIQVKPNSQYLVMSINKISIFYLINILLLLAINHDYMLLVRKITSKMQKKYKASAAVLILLGALIAVKYSNISGSANILTVIFSVAASLPFIGFCTYLFSGEERIN